MYGDCVENTPEGLLCLPQRYAAETLDAFSKHYAEDEGLGDEAEPPSVVESFNVGNATGWRCARCDYHNDDGADVCEMCEGNVHVDPDQIDAHGVVLGDDTVIEI